MTGATEILEAFTEDDIQAAAPEEPELLAAVPAPRNPEIEKLEEIAPRHRVLLVRAGAVIAVTTLISVGGAVLIHALAAGVIVIGLLFPGMVPGTKKGGQTALGLADVGGSPGGFTILGNGPDDNAPPAPTAPTVLGVPVTGLPNALPSLPEMPTTPAVVSVASPVQAVPTLPSDFGTAPITPPQLTAAAPSLRNNVQVAPPGTVENGAPSSVNPGMAARGTGEGDGGGEEDRIMAIRKGDGTPGDGGGGSGMGQGRGRGNGIDRGMAMGDRGAQPLNQASIDAKLIIPEKYLIHPPDKDVTLAIAVAADGTVTSVRVQESCGYPDLDEVVRSFYQAISRFTPEYRAGKPVDSVQIINYSFHPF